MDLFGTLVNEDRFLRNAEKMTPAERRWAMGASQEEIREAAKGPGTTDNPNPFWYH